LQTTVETPTIQANSATGPGHHARRPVPHPLMNAGRRGRITPAAGPSPGRRTSRSMEKPRAVPRAPSQSTRRMSSLTLVTKCRADELACKPDTGTARHPIFGAGSWPQITADSPPDQLPPGFNTRARTGRKQPWTPGHDRLRPDRCWSWTVSAAWRVKDSNLGRHQPTDLQSAPIGRSGNPPGGRTHRPLVTIHNL
jgi:hypothetical protein